MKGVPPLDALTGVLLACIIVNWLLLLAKCAQVLWGVRGLATAPLCIAVLAMLTGTTTVMSGMLLALMIVRLGILCLKTILSNLAGASYRLPHSPSLVRRPLPTLDTGQESDHHDAAPARSLDVYGPHSEIYSKFNGPVPLRSGCHTHTSFSNGEFHGE